VAPVRRHGPRPGPCEKAIAWIWLGGVLASFSALCMVSPAVSAWCLAASRGWIPPWVGMYVLVMLARILPSNVAIPTLKSSAVDSIPRMCWGFLGFFGMCFGLCGFWSDMSIFLFIECAYIFADWNLS